MTIESHVQNSSLGKFITLFQLDLTNLGGEISYFTAGPLDGAAVLFDGNSYVPLPIQADGFEWSGKGSLPTPKIKLANINGLLVSTIIQYSDLVGGTLTRIRTFDRFLDTGAEPDPTAIFPIDVYRVERKSNQNKVFVEWELSASLDQEGVMLPFRQVIRDFCSHTYRLYDTSTGSFSYTKATCPYAGTNYFTELGVATESNNDKCGKRLSDCKLRFGETAVLPTRAFPGVARIK